MTTTDHTTDAIVYLCPVCESRCKIERDHMDYTLCESLEECPTCDYVSRFAYGSYSLYVGGNEWHWSYKESVLEEKARRSKIDQAIENAKRTRMNATDDEYLALLEAIRTNPADDAPRLIIADWLEELGEDERAKEIREAIEEFRSPCPVPVNAESSIRGECGCPYCKQRTRKAFLNLGEVPGRVKCFVSRGFISEIRLTCAEFMGGDYCMECNGRGVLIVGHEFVDGDNCPRCAGTGRVEGVARELFSTMPITRVVLTDKKPSESSQHRGLYRWYTGGPTYDEGEIQQLIFDKIDPNSAVWPEGSKMPYHQSEAAALSALSDACVAYGRELAGLPTLTPV
jgi:uncharacterized protein (TIGR02996 family)